MPLYEYHCKSCNTNFEELVFGDRDQKKACPKCSSLDTEKIPSVIGAITSGTGNREPACKSAGMCGAAGTSCCQSGSCGLH